MTKNTPTSRLIDRAKLEAIKSINDRYFDSELLSYEILMKQPMPMAGEKDFEKRSKFVDSAKHQKLAWLIALAKLSATLENKPLDKTEAYARLLERTRSHVDTDMLAQAESDLDALGSDE